MQCWCLLSLLESKTQGKAVNVVLCLLSLLESKTRIKSSKCRVVFAVIVGEQDTDKKQ